MWRQAPTVLLCLLAGSGAASARSDQKLEHKTQQAKAGSKASRTHSEPLFEMDPRPGPEVLSDAEILNRDEIVSLSRKYGSDLANALLDGERQRERAVRERDSIKLSCIQDRLSNMKLMKKLADDHQSALDRPAIRADDLRMRHEFRGVEMAHDKVIELHRELLECVGENLEVTVSDADGREVTNSSTRVVDPASAVTDAPTTDRPIAASPTN